MLVRLSIRDVVLIDKLDVEFNTGLCVLTGETGAGKSILLDALGLALGQRADSSLVRRGAERAVVSAAFEIEPDHAVAASLRDRGLDAGRGLVLRRVLRPDGRSRAFVNDQPVTVGLLADLGGRLVEVYGQNDRMGLLDTATHRAALDHFGGLFPAATALSAAFDNWRAAQEDYAAAMRAMSLIDPRRDHEIMDRLARTGVDHKGLWHLERERWLAQCPPIGQIRHRWRLVTRPLGIPTGRPLQEHVHLMGWQDVHIPEVTKPVFRLPRRHTEPEDLFTDRLGPGIGRLIIHE